MPVWKLASADHTVSLNVNAMDEDPHDGAMNGTIIYKGTPYNVSGGWAASGFARQASAFGLSGASQAQGLPAFIAATGIMTGPGTAPARIDILVDVCSTNGTIDDYKGALFPESQ
jgi:hypothetical protein